MDAEARRNLECVPKGALEFVPSAWIARQAAFATFPIAWGGVEEDQLEVVFRQQPFDSSNIQRVDEQDLDACEASVRGSLGGASLQVQVASVEDEREQ